MLKTLTAAAVVLAALAGCTKAAETTSAAGVDFKVDRLFTHDGCTAYRFLDGNYRYFVRCDSGSVSTTSRQSCGKNCTRDVEIPTYSTGHAE